ncbi:hypothetical protein PMAYCL1PPCAC_33183, partial [Pristionchus mayeri]
SASRTSDGPTPGRVRSVPPSKREKKMALRIQLSHGIPTLGPDDLPSKQESDWWNCHLGSDTCPRCNEKLPRVPEQRKSHYKAMHYDIY